jgi:hypothetical protein
LRLLSWQPETVYQQLPLNDWNPTMAPDDRSGCLLALLRLVGIRWGESHSVAERLPYRKRDDFLSAAEISFYHVLRHAVGDRFVICPKVRIADVIFVVDRRRQMTHVNRIDRKHVDFLLCDPDTMVPQVAIELDDASHVREERQSRDDLVDTVFAASGLPLLRCPAKRQYDPRALAMEVDAALSTTRPSFATPDATDSAPLCPKCQVPMVLRTATRGAHSGLSFFGCRNFPECRTTRPVTESTG